MKKKIRYRTAPVQSVDVKALAARMSGRCIVAIDVAKTAMVAGFADAAGQCQQLVRFEHPKQTLVFVALLEALRSLGIAIDVAMEPTGVYGDSLRYQLSRREFQVFRVDPARAHAMESVLDGVPSMHDAKSCTLIAFLHARGISQRWEEKDELEREMRTLIDERELFARPFERALGQLEAVIARVFPELGELIDWSCSWHLHLLAHYPSPARIAEAPNEVHELLHKVSNGAFKRAQEVIRSAEGSLGVALTSREEVLVSELAGYLLDLRARVRKVDQRIREAVEARDELAAMATSFGHTTTAAIIADAGNPAGYDSCAAFEKALGLNLKEHSSGETSGRSPLRITKRGPPRARKYLYLAALRWIQGSEIVRAWYQRRRLYRPASKDGTPNEGKIGAVVAVMRKLARAMVHVARGHSLDPTKLFDVRRLGLAVDDAADRETTPQPDIDTTSLAS